MDARKAERDPKRVGKALSALMVTFREKGADAELIAAAYMSALSDLPPWAVEEAARRFVTGRVPDRNNAFAPSSAEIHIVARAVIAEEYAKEYKLQGLLETKRTIEGYAVDELTEKQLQWRADRLESLQAEIRKAAEAMTISGRA